MFFWSSKNAGGGNAVCGHDNNERLGIENFFSNVSNGNLRKLRLRDEFDQQHPTEG